jgi:hypothetical protein
VKLGSSSFAIVTLQNSCQKMKTACRNEGVGILERIFITCGVVVE